MVTAIESHAIITEAYLRLYFRFAKAAGFAVLLLLLLIGWLVGWLAGWLAG